MRCWLIVNSFVNSDKFLEIYDLIREQADSHDIEMEIKRTDELMCPVQSGFAGLDLPKAAIFWDKDILLAKRLEDAGVRLFNPSSAIEACDNKALTYIILKKNNIPFPKTFFSPKAFPGSGVNNLRFLDAVEKSLDYPFVIKELFGSFGQQVHLAKDRAEAEGIIKDIGYRPFLMQEFIKESSGRDIRVNVVGEKAVCAMLRQNPADFRSNITNGGSPEKHELDKEQEALAIAASKCLGLDFSGVDVLFGKDGPLICEVNSNPHFKSSLDCTGVNMAEFVIEHIVSLQR